MLSITRKSHSSVVKHGPYIRSVSATKCARQTSFFRVIFEITETDSTATHFRQTTSSNQAFTRVAYHQIHHTAWISRIPFYHRNYTLDIVYRFAGIEMATLSRCDEQFYSVICRSQNHGGVCSYYVSRQCCCVSS